MMAVEAWGYSRSLKKSIARRSIHLNPSQSAKMFMRKKSVVYTEVPVRS